MSKKKSTVDDEKGAAAKDAVEKGADLETLRDILFGNQAKATEDRLRDLENGLASARREMGKDLDEFRRSSGAQISTTRDELMDRLDKLGATQSEDTAAGQQNLRTAEKELTASIEKLGRDFEKRLDEIQVGLSAQIDKLGQELGERLMAAQEDARQRDGELRQELLTLSAWLDDQKASRRDLAQMFEDIGQQLAAGGKDAAGGKNPGGDLTDG